MHKAPAKLFASIAAAEHVRDELTAKALAALEQGGDAQAIMQDLAWKLTNRLIHAPTKSLQQAARDGDNERLNILRDSLGLEVAVHHFLLQGAFTPMKPSIVAKLEALHERHEEVQALLGDAQTIADQNVFAHYHANMRS